MFCISALIVSAASAAQGEDYDWQSWGAVTDTTVWSIDQHRLTLSSPFIVAGSEAVYVDGDLFTGDRYEINYQRGVVRFIAPVRDGAVIRVSYIRLPVLLNSVYSLRRIEFADPREVIPQRPSSSKQDDQVFNPAGDLVFGGMKSISLSVGTNKGSSIDQSLQATIEGHLTKNIKVRALLSDNNLPIQPEGNTEELEYLDKVYVEFSGPKANATLGDFSYSNGYSTFSSFHRELKGISGQVRGFDSRVSVAGGSSKGVFRSVKFRGTEQVQGPYDLLAEGRTTGDVIIAGTERVYFDGEILQRGRNRDYTIDYDSGMLTFTPRRMVTADTEIGVDFEVTQQRYDRTSMFGNAESNRLPGGFRFETLVAREADDADRPKTLTLNDEDRSILLGAGDNADRAVAGGVSNVGPGNGDYMLVAADTLAGLAEHYAFNDSTGAYLVSFTEVAVGLGDYKLTGITARGTPIYGFVGKANGNFVIGRKLPAPQSHSLVTTRLVRDSGDRLNIDFEYNMSDFDRNTLSPVGDADNIGDAGKLTIKLKNIRTPVGEFDITESLSTIQQNFQSFGNTRPWYFYTDWNLEGVPIMGREILQQLTTTYRPVEKTALDYEFGLIDRDNFKGVKQEGRASLALGRDRNVNARVFSTDVTGIDEVRTRLHGTASASFGLWAFLPSATYATDEYLLASPARPDSGFAYDVVTVSLAKRQAKKFGYQFQVSERNTRQLADTTNGWRDTRIDRTYKMSLAARGTSVIEGSLEYSHRVQDDLIFGDTRKSDLARVRGLIRFNRIGLRSSIDYEVSQDAFRTLEKTVVYVGTGKGDYNQLGEHVGEGRGDYALVFLPDLKTIPTRNVGLTLRTTWQNPSAGSTGGGVLSWVKRNVSLEQQFSVREATTFSEGYKVYLLFPSALQRDDATLHGIVSLRQDWSLLNGHPSVSLSFRYQRDDEEDNRFAPVKENKFFEQQIVTLDRSISKLLSANVEVRHERRRRAGSGLTTGTGSTYDVSGWAVAGGWGLRLSPGSTLDGQIEYSRREDDESLAEERTVSFRPRFVWRLRKSLNLFGRYELVRFLGDEHIGAKPFFFSRTGSSHRWSSTLNIKWTKVISFLTTYQGRSEDTFSGRRIVEHDFKVETRAFF